MADDDDEDTALDESAYDLSSVKRQRVEEVITMPMSSAPAEPSSSEPAPDCTLPRAHHSVVRSPPR